MPITMRWASEHVFIFDLHLGDWSWSQYDIAVEQAMQIIKSADHDIAAIVLAAPTFPDGNAITHFLRVIKLQPTNLKLYIVVGGNAVTRTMNRILMQMYPKTRIIFAASETEAYKFAGEHGFQSHIE